MVAVLASSAIMLTLSFTTETGRGIASIWAGLVLLFAVVVIVRRVLSTRTVTTQSIYGTVSAYLMIGVAFASFFAAIRRSFVPTGHRIHRLGCGTWQCIVTQGVRRGKHGDDRT